MSEAKRDRADIVTCAMRVKLAREDARCCQVIASTDDVDSHGEIVEQSWDLTRYAANPVVLYGHDSRELPIGHASDVGVVDGRLVATLHFASEKANPRAEQVWQLVREGVLRAVSVGFYPSDVRFEMRDGREVPVLANNELLEISVVPVPANPNALARLHARAAGTRPEETPVTTKLPAVLLAALALAETATPEDAAAAVEKLKREGATLRSAAGRESPEEAVGAIEAYKAAHAALPALTKQRDELVLQVEGFERAKMLAEGVASKKLAALDLDASTERGAKLAAMPLAGLRAHLELAAPVVPADAGPTQPKSADATETLTPDEERICLRMGHDPAEFLASKKAYAAQQRALGRG